MVLNWGTMGLLVPQSWTNWGCVLPWEQENVASSGDGDLCWVQDEDGISSSSLCRWGQKP